jgi:hypothetical protein
MKNYLTPEPTPEQKSLWLAKAAHELGDKAPSIEIAARVADKAYRAGADEELAGCKNFLATTRYMDCISTMERAELIAQLHESRRPRQKDQAKHALDAIAYHNLDAKEKQRAYNIIRGLIDQTPG